MTLPPEQYRKLFALAEKSLESLDIPVGALLLYRGEIIGEGFNTVLRNGIAGGHAEMNAISDALLRLGSEHFSALDRNHLFLISTFEPCLMCAGAFITHNIQYVHYLEKKNLSYVLKEVALFFRYLFRRKRLSRKNDQRELFLRHPLYPGRNDSPTTGRE